LSAITSRAFILFKKYCTIHPSNSGRSDATLNRGGIRAGTAELYAVVDALDGVSDSLAVHLEDPEGGPGTLVLVVSPRPASDEAALSLAASIKAAIRREVSPRHVPDVVVFSDRIPRTLSGKRIEVPLKRLLLGRPLEETVSLGSLADPDALEPLVAAVKAALVAGPSGAKTS
jgi:acetoacetyl-CoA synthetase